MMVKIHLEEGDVIRDGNRAIIFRSEGEDRIAIFLPIDDDERHRVLDELDDVVELLKRGELREGLSMGEQANLAGKMEY